MSLILPKQLYQLLVLQELYTINWMYLKIQKPAISLLPKRHSNDEQLNKYIVVYTNQIANLTKTQIVEFMIANGKMRIFDSKYEYKNLNASDIYLNYLDSFKNRNISWFVDYIFAEGLSLNQFSSFLDFPLSFQIIIRKNDNRISSLTSNINFGMFGISDSHLFIESLLRQGIIIGKGSFSTIHLIRQLDTKIPCCLKLINKARCSQIGQLQYIHNQFEFLTDPSVRYGACQKYFINLKYAVQNEQWIGFFLQWGVYGNLYSWIKSNQSQKYHKKYQSQSPSRKNLVYFYFIQVSLAICKLHRLGYIYRDLKPQNVIIDIKGNAKLCDFGYTTKIKDDQYLSQLCGSYEYLPPQFIQGKKYNKSYDLYCLGLLFYEMLTCRNPFEGITSKNIQKAKQIKIEYRRKYIQENAQDLIKLLMKQNPQERIGFGDTSEIFKHKFFMQNEQIVLNTLSHTKCNQYEFFMKNFELQTLNLQNLSFLPTTSINKKDIKLFGKQNYINYNYLIPQVSIDSKIGPKIFLK